MVVIRYVAETREVGVESDYKGDFGFGGIVDGFVPGQRVWEQNELC